MSSKAINDYGPEAPAGSSQRRRIEGTPTAAIARYWLMRMRFIRILKVKV